MSYCNERLTNLGITEELNGFINDDLGKDYRQKYFVPDKYDNIRINYYKLDRLQYKYKSNGRKWGTNFYRTRLKFPKADMKYSQPKGSPVLPFFTPYVIDQFNNGRSIETLFFTEGEFKAYAASMVDLPVVGFPSISGCYHNDVRRTFHDDIMKLIMQCGVKNLVFITDADTFTVNYEPGKDLSKRPNFFYSAVTNFYEASQTLIEQSQADPKAGDSSEIKPQVRHAYWCHIKTDYAKSAKGLDDLLLQFPARHQAICSELKSFSFKEFFDGHLLNPTRLKNLKKTFGISNAEDFYQMYKPFIGREPFRWKNYTYQWDENDYELKRLKHRDADNYFRIGKDWYKMVKVPNAEGKKEDLMIPYAKAEIKEDYLKECPDFIKQCYKYDWFCNVPSINGTYQRVVDKCYNLFHPIQHEMKEGDCLEASLKFLKHLFDNKNMVRTLHYTDPQTGKQKEHTVFCAEIGDQFSVALDWLSVLVQHPTQNLPVPCLVSEKEGTGKTTFLNWLVAIFGNNATILDKSRFEMNFNGHYASKFIIGLDEGFLEVDKKAEKERLKQMVTSNTIFLEQKGADVKEIPFYGKVIICSNDADRLMKVDENDSRWFVVNVPQFTEENPYLLETLQEEIPAFLHFLYYRKPLHPKASRLWFKKEWFITEQLQIIIRSTRNRLDKVIEEVIKDMFLTYKLAELKLDLKWLTKEINTQSKYKHDVNEVRDYLKKRKGMQALPSKEIKIPIGFEPGRQGQGLDISWFKTRSRAYCFKLEEWLSEEELKEHEENKDQDNEGDEVPF